MSKSLQKNLEAKMAALDGPEWDSSDDEEEKVQTKKKSKKDGAQDAIAADVMKKQLKKEKMSKKKDENPADILYIGHLPHDFEEVEMLTFFSQFGKVANLKLCRSRKTGNSKGYGFIQFQDYEVSAIVAETMNGYIIMNEKRLVCHLVPPDKVHSKLFRGAKQRLVANKRGDVNISRRTYWQEKNEQAQNRKKSAKVLQQITKRLVSREDKKREMLTSLGIDYDFPGYAASAKTIKSNSGEKPAKDETASVTNSEKNEVSTEKDLGSKTSNDTKASKKKRKASIDENSEAKSTTESKSDKAQDEDDVVAVTPKKRKSSIDKSKSTKSTTKSKKKSKKIEKDSKADEDTISDEIESERNNMKTPAKNDDKESTATSSKTVPKSQKKKKSKSKKRLNSEDGGDTTKESISQDKEGSDKIDALEAAREEVKTPAKNDGAKEQKDDLDEIKATPKVSKKKKSIAPKTTDGKKKSKKEKKRRKSVA